MSPITDYILTSMVCPSTPFLFSPRDRVQQNKPIGRLDKDQGGPWISRILFPVCGDGEDRLSYFSLYSFRSFYLDLILSPDLDLILLSLLQP